MSSFRDTFNPIFSGAPVMNAFRFEDIPNFSNEMRDQTNLWLFRTPNSFNGIEGNNCMSPSLGNQGSYDLNLSQDVTGAVIEQDNLNINPDAVNLYDSELLVDELLPSDYSYTNINDLASSPPPQVANMLIADDINISQDVLDTQPVVIEGFSSINNSTLVTLIVLIIVIVLIYFLNKRY